MGSTVPGTTRPRAVTALPQDPARARPTVSLVIQATDICRATAMAPAVPKITAAHRATAVPKATAALRDPVMAIPRPMATGMLPAAGQARRMVMGQAVTVSQRATVRRTGTDQLAARGEMPGTATRPRVQVALGRPASAGTAPERITGLVITSRAASAMPSRRLAVTAGPGLTPGPDIRSPRPMITGVRPGAATAPMAYRRAGMALDGTAGGHLVPGTTRLAPAGPSRTTVSPLRRTAPTTGTGHRTIRQVLTRLASTRLASTRRAPIHR